MHAGRLRAEVRSGLGCSRHAHGSSEGVQHTSRLGVEVKVAQLAVGLVVGLGALRMRPLRECRPSVQTCTGMDMPFLRVLRSRTGWAGFVRCKKVSTLCVCVLCVCVRGRGSLIWADQR